MTAFKSAAIWTAIFLLTFFLFVVQFVLTAMTFPFDPKRKWVHAQCFWWANAIIKLNPFWQVTVSGLENIDRRQTYVIVANHQSLADIIVLYETGMQFKWVAKKSLFRIPVIGWCLYLCRHIHLERGDMSSIKQVYRDAAQWLQKGISVLFFPEGTRSRDEKMGEFQNGAFKLAIKEKKPILPIRIESTTEAIPKGSWVFKTKVHGRMTVLPPVSTETFAMSNFSALRDLVKSQIEGRPISS